MGSLMRQSNKMNSSKNNEIKREDVEKAWEYYKHVDSLYTGRTNFFLVAESMLLLAFVSIFAVGASEFKFSNIIKCGIAIY
ncbi:MAG TPA: hypothetical protein ENI51_03170 [Candidatus Atribacteria bacterium]|nr:hypothetical protein [Candidatus Atribacteria bacterium]